jgi:GNAT superfamily N-acetyltransferase
MPQSILTDFSTAALDRANAVSRGRFFGLWLQRPETYLQNDHLLQSVLTDIPLASLNTISAARLTGDQADAAIAEAITRSRAAGIPIMWWVTDSDRPLDLENRLTEHGFVNDNDHTPGMAVDLAVLPAEWPLPPGVSIEMADRQTLPEWLEVLQAGYHLPDSIIQPLRRHLLRPDYDPRQPVQYYLARLDGKPISISALLMGAGVAGIYIVVTLEEARGKGAGSAVVWQCLADARAQGYRIGVLQSSDMGFPVYQRLGFEQHGVFRRYVWSPQEK